jgi:hypothetical protein
MSTFWAMSDSCGKWNKKINIKRANLSYVINEWNLWEMHMEGVGQWGMN